MRHYSRRIVDLINRHWSAERISRNHYYAIRYLPHPRCRYLCLYADNSCSEEFKNIVKYILYNAEDLALNIYSHDAFNHYLLSTLYVYQK